ncbi:MAG TPA: type II toxin-antitoxin system Phd/YefM family antitoxin [Longimicrobiaceae bacterium]|nr:type II toxin-antitoxin system Phd/YefM family antitoxin [Longimicrobiaceae bacterium]
MRFTRDIRPVSEFRANAAALINQVRETRRPLVLTQHGKGAAVLLNVEEYERLVERAELIEDVATSEDQLRHGQGITHEKAQERLRSRLTE